MNVIARVGPPSLNEVLEDTENIDESDVESLCLDEVMRDIPIARDANFEPTSHQVMAPPESKDDTLQVSAEQISQPTAAVAVTPPTPALPQLTGQQLSKPLRKQNRYKRKCLPPISQSAILQIADQSGIPLEDRNFSADLLNPRIEPSATDVHGREIEVMVTPQSKDDDPQVSAEQIPETPAVAVMPFDPVLAQFAGQPIRTPLFGAWTCQNNELQIKKHRRVHKRKKRFEKIRAEHYENLKKRAAEEELIRKENEYMEGIWKQDRERAQGHIVPSASATCNSPNTATASVQVSEPGGHIAPSASATSNLPNTATESVQVSEPPVQTLTHEQRMANMEIFCKAVIEVSPFITPLGCSSQRPTAPIPPELMNNGYLQLPLPQVPEMFTVPISTSGPTCKNSTSEPATGVASVETNNDGLCMDKTNPASSKVVVVNENDKNDGEAAMEQPTGDPPLAEVAQIDVVNLEDQDEQEEFVENAIAALDAVDLVNLEGEDDREHNMDEGENDGGDEESEQVKYQLRKYGQPAYKGFAKAKDMDKSERCKEQKGADGRFKVKPKVPASSSSSQKVQEKKTYEKGTRVGKMTDLRRKKFRCNRGKKCQEPGDADNV